MSSNEKTSGGKKELSDMMWQVHQFYEESIGWHKEDNYDRRIFV